MIPFLDLVNHANIPAKQNRYCYELKYISICFLYLFQSHSSYTISFKTEKVNTEEHIIDYKNIVLAYRTTGLRPRKSEDIFTISEEDYGIFTSF